MESSSHNCGCSLRFSILMDLVGFLKTALNGICVALGKICFLNICSWKLQICSQLYSFHDYYLSCYSSSICLLLLPCTFHPSLPEFHTHTHTHTHSLDNFYLNRQSRFLDPPLPPPPHTHLILFKTCLSQDVIILFNLFYFSVIVNFLAVRICGGNVIFMRHNNKEVQIQSLSCYLYLSTSFVQ
jgi:hypothetical protein